MAHGLTHVVYGGAHLFSAKTPAKLEDLARAAALKFAREPEDLRAAFGELPADVRARAEKPHALDP